ncbi:MAG: anthranilate phosphoribosyltransferase, partial [Phycisphaerae bacterium]
MNIQTAIHHVASGNDLSEQQAHSVAKTIVAGDATPAQIGAILVGLRAKGETVEEILGVVRAMREQMTKVHVPGDSLVDTCGTGGDAVAVDGIPTGTFNVSTVAAFVAAAAGCR